MLALFMNFLAVLKRVCIPLLCLQVIFLYDLSYNIQDLNIDIIVELQFFLTTLSASVYIVLKSLREREHKLD